MLFYKLTKTLYSKYSQCTALIVLYLNFEGRATENSTHLGVGDGSVVESAAPRDTPVL